MELRTESAVSVSLLVGLTQGLNMGALGKPPHKRVHRVGTLT